MIGKVNLCLAPDQKYEARQPTQMHTLGGVFTGHSVCVCMWCGPALVFIAAAAEAAVVTEATAAPSRSCTRPRVTAAPVLNGLVLTE